MAWFASTTATVGAWARITTAAEGIITGNTVRSKVNFTCRYIPGRRALSGLGTWTSVSRVRVFGSRASAVRATVPANVRAGSSRRYTVAAWPDFIAVENTCGTFTQTRTVSVRIRWNSSRVVV